MLIIKIGVMTIERKTDVAVLHKNVEQLSNILNYKEYSALVEIIHNLYSLLHSVHKYCSVYGVSRMLKNLTNK